jgi:3-deoxy-manno-octulosonate cytidylyltransferase (CMP-KDO synthetase)
VGIDAENGNSLVVAIIPARFASTRLPGKLLLDLNGKPLLLHTIEQASKAKTLSRVVVATDNQKIYETVTASGYEAVMTSPLHPSGSDRVAEAALAFPSNSIIVNIQGDEPMISPSTIDAAVNALINDSSADVVTTSEGITDAHDVLNPNVVKVVTDKAGFALYFSRSPVPYPRDFVGISGSLELALANDPALTGVFRKHTGLYAYRRDFLLNYTALEPSPLESIEMLEQLRILEHGAKIKIVEVADQSIGVDTPEDFARVTQKLAAGSIIYR